MLEKLHLGMEHYATRSMMDIPLSCDLHNPICEDATNTAGGGRSPVIHARPSRVDRSQVGMAEIKKRLEKAGLVFPVNRRTR